jgi:hypothetical protein
MTALLERVFSEAQKLSEKDQDILGSIILEELRAEQKWDMLFASSQDTLKNMAAEALQDYKDGKTSPLQFQ